MHKFGNLIISGTEVYAVPQAPTPRPSYEHDAAGPERRQTPLLTVLLHTLAVGGLPLPLPGRGR